jgi:hypothetical protein
MKKHVKVWCVMVMLIMVSSVVGAFEEPVPQDNGSSQQVQMDGQDVITASDAGGGYLSSRDMILIILLGVGFLVLLTLL